MKLLGRLFFQGKIVKDALVKPSNSEASFHDQLEECLLVLCKELDTPVPLWMKKNTKEFASFRKTWFDKEQFMENVWFDRLHIWIEENEDDD